MADNEIGTIHPVGRLAEMAHQSGGLVFIDLAQAVGKIPVDVRAERIDLGALSALHKLYGPKGVGALFIRSGEPAIELEPQIVGGGQEEGLQWGNFECPWYRRLRRSLPHCQAGDDGGQRAHRQTA